MMGYAQLPADRRPFRSTPSRTPFGQASKQLGKFEQVWTLSSCEKTPKLPLSHSADGNAVSVAPTTGASQIGRTRPRSPRAEQTSSPMVLDPRPVPSQTRRMVSASWKSVNVGPKKREPTAPPAAVGGGIGAKPAGGGGSAPEFASASGGGVKTPVVVFIDPKPFVAELQNTAGPEVRM